MEHVVFYPGPDGSPAFRRAGSLAEAVRLVEHLRNNEAVSDLSLHLLAEVPLRFRASYRAEVSPVGAHTPTPEPMPEVPTPIPDAAAGIDPVMTPAASQATVPEPRSAAGLPGEDRLAVRPIEAAPNDSIPVGSGASREAATDHEVGFFAS